MKKIILVLALGFFTFSATSLMAQTPKKTSVETAEVSTRTTTETPRRTCGTKSNRAMNGKHVKGHGKNKARSGSQGQGQGQGQGRSVNNNVNARKTGKKHPAKTCNQKRKGQSANRKTGKKQTEGLEVRNGRS